MLKIRMQEPEARRENHSLVTDNSEFIEVVSLEHFMGNVHYGKACQRRYYSGF